ncbi:MAG: hypothetical protein HY695_38820 [Deltaproteobacteria bacterium]|nr:hypothetical protein [Deltaproteobacteria bacterium]
MKPGQKITINRLIRSQRTGKILPREGTFVRELENLGRMLILVDFGGGTQEYLFRHEIDLQEEAFESGI